MSTQREGAGSSDGRFAPSPTGTLHYGNLRTALLAWLFARSAGARFLVRVEDLDPDRVVPGLAQLQLADLAAIGLDWDGEPVHQTERLDLYSRALQQLQRDELVYACFCSRAEIREAASAPHGPATDGAYPGTCSQLAASDARERAAAGEAHCLRARCGGVTIGFDDRVLGNVSERVDDFVVVRKDSVPAYNLAVVVDDAAQCIGEVVRGADLAASTPRQLWLMRALGLAEPRHAHVPLVLGGDGRRLGKRHGSVTLADWQSAGHGPAAMRASMACTLGLAERGEAPDMAVLLERFDPAGLPTDPTVLDDITVARSGSA